jgi:mono/diheme cytochrome c family protein
MKYTIPGIILAALILTACSFSLAADVTPPPGAQAPVITQQPSAQQVSNALYPLVPPNPAAGQEIYLEKCAPCHGQTGLGDGERAAGLPNPVAAIGTAELARNASPTQWYTVVSQGNLERFMPPFPSLNDRQRWDVIAYVFSLSQPVESSAQGGQLYQVECAACHGKQGKGDGPQAAGKTMADFTDQEYMASQPAANLFQEIASSESHAQADFANKLSEDQRWALAGYLRSLSFAATGDLAAVTPEAVQAGSTVAESAEPVAATEVISPTISVGVISGLVTNGSGGELPTGAEVMLHGFDQMQVAITQTTTVAPDGIYTFSNVEMPDGRMFFTSLQHQGSSFGSDVATATADTNNLDLPITIYDTTQDTSTLKIDRLHLFFEQADTQTMRVAELLVISNDGSKAIVAKEPGQPVVTFNLPEGFQNLQFQDGELGGRYIQTADGFGDTSIIYPGKGSYQVLLAYDLPYNHKLSLSQTLTMPADAVVILVPEQSFKVRGENLQDAGTRDMSGVPYQMYNLSSIEAGEQLKLSVSSSSTLLGNGTRTGLIVGLSALGLALILGGVWLYWKNRNQESELEEAVPVSAAPGANAVTEEELMDAILALDDLYTSHQIPEDVYIERRNELKARLKEVLGS